MPSRTSKKKSAQPRTARLSSRPIPANERLILALDVPTAGEARRLVQTLGEAIHFYKLGLQLCMSGEYFTLLRWLRESGKKVFADLKLFDVPQTVGSAVKELARWDVQFATIHATGDEILKAAVAEKKTIQLLAVTVLTSLDKTDLKHWGFQSDVRKLVLSRAKRAIALGCDGVISSGLEVAALRKNLGNDFLVVTPGIRPAGAARSDDQKRIATVEEAFANGADYIVVGRGILKAPDPLAAATAIQTTIARLFSAQLPVA